MFENFLVMIAKKKKIAIHTRINLIFGVLVRKIATKVLNPNANPRTTN